MQIRTSLEEKRSPNTSDELDQRVLALMHQNCQEAKEETIRMMDKQVEQAQMKAEVHRMNMNSQVHEMCSLIESLQKM